METINNNKILKIKTIKFIELNCYTNKEKNSLKKGFDIWCSGCLGGSWEDEEFSNEFSNNLNWEYFINEFGEILNLDRGSENYEYEQIVINTFKNYQQPLTKQLKKMLNKFIKKTK